MTDWYIGPTIWDILFDDIKLSTWIKIQGKETVTDDEIIKLCKSNHKIKQNVAFVLPISTRSAKGLMG